MENSNWIWLNKSKYGEYYKGQPTIFSNQGKYAIVKFVKEFESSKNCEALIKITADTKFSLYINGVYISNGPAVVGGDYGNDKPLGWCFYDTIKTSLIKGINTIEVLVQNIPEVMADYSSGIPALKMSINYDKNIIVTDNSWRAYIDHRYTDFRTFDDTKEIEFANFAEVYDKQIEILDKNIPELEYVTKTANNVYIKDGKTVLDFGKIIAGYIKVKTNKNFNAIITIEPLEIFDRMKYPETVISNGKPLNYLGFRLQSFRYLTVSGVNDINDLEVSVFCPNFPCPNEGFLSFLDDDIELIIKNSINTLKLCRQTYFLDSPIHQEALGCLGDYFIESMMSYAYLGEFSLSRLDILRTSKYLLSHDGVMFHTTYELLWIRWVLEHYNYTKDITLINEVMPAVELVLQKFISYCDNNWLDNPPNYMFVDWYPVGNFNLHHPPRTMGEGVINAMFFDALTAIIKLYKITKQFEKTDKIRKLKNNLKKEFNKRLFDSEKGLYISGNYKEELENKWKPIDKSNTKYYLTQTNILAVAYGLCPKKIAQSIMEKVVNDKSLIQCQPYFYFYYFNALYKAKLYDKYGLLVMKNLKGICINGGLKEVFSNRDCDYSHAWCGSALYSIIVHYFEITPNGKPTKKVLKEKSKNFTKQKCKIPLFNKNIIF